MKNIHGYMLLEVVLALSIFILAVVGLIQTLNAALDADFEQRRLTDARISLQNILDATRGLPLSPGTTTTEPDAYNLVYRRIVEPTTVRLRSGLQLPGVMRVTVQAIDTTRDGRVIEEVQSYVQL